MSWKQNNGLLSRADFHEHGIVEKNAKPTAVSLWENSGL